MTLPSGVEQPREVRVSPRSGTVRIEESEFAGLACGDLTVSCVQCGEHLGVGEVPVAGVEVVVAPHRACGQPAAHVAWEAFTDVGAEDVPDGGV